MDMEDFLQGLSAANGGRKFEFVGFVPNEKVRKIFDGRGQCSTVDEAISAKSHQDIIIKRMEKAIEEIENGQKELSV